MEGFNMFERFKKIRKALKLSQAEFGERIGISRDTVANIEGGRIEIKDVFIKAICREFHVSENWLRTGEGEMFTQLDPEDELMEWVGKLMAAQPEDFRRKFVKMLSQLTDDQWKILEEKCMEVAGQIK